MTDAATSNPEVTQLASPKADRQLARDMRQRRVAHIERRSAER